MCSGRFRFFSKVSSTAFEIACTCRVLAPVQIRKYSVKEAALRRSSTTRSVAFFSDAARAAIVTPSSVSSGCTSDSGCLFTLRPICLLPVQLILGYVIGDVRRNHRINRSPIAHALPYLSRRQFVVHIAGQVYVLSLKLFSVC